MIYTYIYTYIHTYMYICMGRAGGHTKEQVVILEKTRGRIRAPAGHYWAQPGLGPLPGTIGFHFGFVLA